MGAFVVYPPSQKTEKKLASGLGSAISSRYFACTPIQRLSSLLHEVTQCISALTSSVGSSFHSSQVKRSGFSTRPTMVKSQVSGSNVGVGPEVRIGHLSPTRY